jgi:hypothetical protein
MLSDLEAVKACAEMMGYEVVQRNARKSSGWWSMELCKHYDPLTDDAQCMALVKRFKIDCLAADTGNWLAGMLTPCAYSASHADLNRAIVYCVAQMKGER